MILKQVFQKNILTAVVFAVALTFMASSQALAVDTNTANTLKVTPVRSDIEIKAGASKTVEVTVSNLTDGQITVRAVQNDFVAGDERGTPALILDDSKFAPTHSLKRFMTPLKDITIPAKQAKTIGVVITVPEDAQAGGYFGAVRFAPTSPDDGGQVNLSASVASLMLLTVPGDAVEKLDLTSFEIQKHGKTAPFFTDGNALQATFRFENKGSVQAGPTGKISIKKGDKVVYETDFNDGDLRDVVLPDSARRWDVPLEKVSGFGNYTVSATFTYGTKNQTVEMTKTFWVIPWVVIVGAIVGLLVVVAIIAAVVKASRSRRPSGRRRR